MKDDDGCMARFIRQHDSLEGREARFDFLDAHGIPLSVLKSWRHRLERDARAARESAQSPTPTPDQEKLVVERPVQRRRAAQSRRPRTRLRSGGPRTYQTVRTRRMYGGTSTTVVLTITITFSTER